MGEGDSEDMVVLPDHLFVRAMLIRDPTQDENIVKQWVDPHWLKKLGNQWMKDGKKVITRAVEERRELI